MAAATLGILRGSLSAGLIIAWIWADPPAAALKEALPTFGTTVVAPGGFRGVIYPINADSTYLPFLTGLHPLGVIYTSTLNVPTRNFQEGFPGVTDRVEWFAIDYSGRFWIEKPGIYSFELTSDDGSRLYIDDQLIVNNDGIHPAETLTADCALAGGIHRIRVPYFQGPGGAVALVLRVAPPGEEWRIFSMEEFKPPPDPATWKYLGQALRMSSATSAAGEEVRLELSLDSATASALSVLKWELVFPVQLLELEGQGPERGNAAIDSNKSLACTQQKPYPYSGTLSGGRGPIANGPVAILRFKIRTTAEAGMAAVRIERTEAVTVDSKKMTLKDAEGTIVIR